MKTLLWFLLLVFPPFLTALSNSAPKFQIGCSPTTTNSTQQYEEALNQTFSILNTASSTAYFSNATSGSAPGGQAYAAYLCRYDIPLATCRECVHNSTSTAAPSSSSISCTDGEISYGLCTLRYANRPISPDLDSTLSSFWCLDPAPNGPFLVQSAVEGAAAGLIDRATANASRNYYFATGEQVDTLNRTMYGMVQCAPDMNATECRQCLNLTLQTGLMGCRLSGVSAGIYGYTGSCSVTYSLYAFYKTSSNSSVTPQPLTSRLLPAASSSPKFGPDIFISTAVLIVLLLVMEMAQG